MRWVRMLPAMGVLVLAQAGAAQEGLTGTVLVANMDDDSVWLLDLASGNKRGEITTHVPPH